MFLFTNPATTRPPTVPCDPIDAQAILEITESCSGVMLTVDANVFGELES